MRNFFLAIFAFTLASALHAQDTTYYDANDKLVASLALAQYYKVTLPDSINPKWTRELTFYKSGKIQADAILSRWQKNNISTHYERTYKEWYESGKLHKVLEFSKGKLNGKALTYWENGQLKHDGLYENESCKKGENYNQDGSKAKDGPYRKPAEYPGGNTELNKYISKNFTKVIQERDTAYFGKVSLVFMINKDGSISDISVEKYVAPWITELGIQTIKNMPKWSPAINDAEVHKMQEIIPVEIRKKNDKSPYIFADVMPDFPGGLNMMMQFLSQNIRYPVQAQINKIQGMVIVSFIVSKEGDINNIELVRGIHPDCNAEAIRVIKLMPRWTPGEKDGEKVNVKFTLPIRFSLR